MDVFALGTVRYEIDYNLVLSSSNFTRPGTRGTCLDIELRLR